MPYSTGERQSRIRTEIQLNELFVLQLAGLDFFGSVEITALMTKPISAATYAAIEAAVARLLARID